MGSAERAGDGWAVVTLDSGAGHEGWRVEMGGKRGGRGLRGQGSNNGSCHCNGRVVVHSDPLDPQSLLGLTVITSVCIC